jgi:hypothetical protein
VAHHKLIEHSGPLPPKSSQLACDLDVHGGELSQQIAKHKWDSDAHNVLAILKIFRFHTVRILGVKKITIGGAAMGFPGSREIETRESTR